MYDRPMEQNLLLSLIYLRTLREGFSTTEDALVPVRMPGLSI